MVVLVGLPPPLLFSQLDSHSLEFLWLVAGKRRVGAEWGRRAFEHMASSCHVLSEAQLWSLFIFTVSPFVYPLSHPQNTYV